MATQPGAPIEEPAEKRGAMLTVGEHLTEARQRLTIAALTVVLTTVVSLVFTNDILEFLIDPAREADPDFRPIFTELLGFVGAYVKIGLLVGIGAAMPMLVYQGFMFITPGLEPYERRWLIPIVLMASLSFAGGGAFAFFIAWPPALDFLLDFGDNIANPQIRINNYIDMLTRFIFWTGVVFETPLVLMGFGWLGLLTASRLIRAWRWAIIFSFVVAALITPSIDPVTQAAVAIPLIGLYGIGIGLVWLVQSRGLGRAGDGSAPEEDR